MREVEGVGKTYDEAVNDGLKKIGLPKEKVTIELIEEPKKRFFSILEHRDVKVKIVEIENKEPKKVVESKVQNNYTPDDEKRFLDKANRFLDDYINGFGLELTYTAIMEDNIVKVNIIGDKAGLIIGYRGETLEALQTVINTAVNLGEKTKVFVLVDAENYRKKREKALEELALKVAGTVVSKHKRVTLEPMGAYERKIIHTALQNNSKVKSESVGEEPYRKVVISLKQR